MTFAVKPYWIRSTGLVKPSEMPRSTIPNFNWKIFLLWKSLCALLASPTALVKNYFVVYQAITFLMYNKSLWFLDSYCGCTAYNLIKGICLVRNKSHAGLLSWPKMLKKLAEINVFSFPFLFVFLILTYLTAIISVVHPCLL